ncbi:MAG TPA: hypothetical protein VN802_02440 [Stellaceae bacterium]|nr:hypothetical protein [Stellaceae bacterium]
MSGKSSDPPPGSPRYAINRAIFDLTRRPDARAVVADKKADFIAAYELRPEERQALMGPEWKHLLELGVLPNLVYRYYMLHGKAPESFPAAVAAEG